MVYAILLIVSIILIMISILYYYTSNDLNSVNIEIDKLSEITKILSDKINNKQPVNLKYINKMIKIIEKLANRNKY